MKSHVARLLKQPARTRRMMSVSLDNEQMELVEKLSLFFSRETSHAFSKNQVVEEAVRAFTDESAEYISETYDMDIRSATLTEMREYKRNTSVGVAAFDTIVIPFRDNEPTRQRLFKENSWYPVRLDKDKLQRIRYLAMYFGSPVMGITHYAAIAGQEPIPGEQGAYKLILEPSEELGRVVELGYFNASRLRRPRYTTLAMLLEARTMDELF